MSSPMPSEPQPHFTLQGRYEVIAKRGTGGMSTVYQARDLRFGNVQRWCAVKEMIDHNPDFQTRSLNLANFEREANLLASLNHPAIPKVFDYFSQDEKRYLILEFIEGNDLEEVWMQTRRPLPVDEVVDWTLQVCDVLQYLHTRTPPIVFRDIKPSNIMLSRTIGRIFLVDFGIARTLQPPGSKGTMIGTDGYAPPEQYRGLAEPRGDVYALGATMHHLLTGTDPRLEAPFTFSDRPLRAANPLVSAELEAAIVRSLEYDMDRRYPSVAEFSLALKRAHGVTVMGGGSATALLPQTPADKTGPMSAPPVPSTGPKGKSDAVRPVWTFRCEDEVRSSPRIADGRLLIGSYDHNLYALEVADGRFQWKFATEGGVSSTAAVYEATILVGSEDQHLYAVDARGQQVWRAATEGPIRSSPKVVAGAVVVGSDDACVYAFGLATGEQMWRFRAEQPVRSSGVAVHDNVVIGCDDGNLYALRMTDGRYRWKYRVGRFIMSTPLVFEGLVIIGGGDGSVHAIDGRSAMPIWRTRTGGPIVSSPTVANGICYIGSADGALYALDARSGRTLWKSVVGSQIVSTPAVGSNAVFFGSVDGRVHAIEVKGGKPRWSYQTGGPVTSSPVFEGGRIYVGSADQNVYALPA